MLRRPGFSLSTQAPSVSFNELTFGVTGSTTSGTSTSSGSRSTPSHIIVGDTASAMFYAVDVLYGDNTTNVVILVEGPNNLCKSGVSHAQFGDQAIRDGYLRQYPNVFVAQDSPDRTTNISLPYGLSAEAIATYPSEVEYPPILNTRNRTGAAGLVGRLTIETQSTTGEKTIINSLSGSLGVPVSTEIVTDCPSISLTHRTFEQCINSRSQRDVGLSAYDILTTRYADRCIFYFACEDIGFSNPQANRVYDVTFHYRYLRSKIKETVTGKVYLKSNVYSNVRIATNGGLPTLEGFVNTLSVPGGSFTTPYSDLSTYIPTTYRAVFAVPANSTNAVGQRLNMTLPSTRAGTRVSTKAWVVQSFTTVEDLRPERNVYAPEGKILVVIEAVSILGRRIMYWDIDNQQFINNLNTNDQEQLFLEEFIGICGKFAVAYGLPSLPPLIEPMVAESGVVSDYTHVEGVTRFIANPFLLINECLVLFNAGVNSSLV